MVNDMSYRITFTTAPNPHSPSRFTLYPIMIRKAASLFCRVDFHYFFMSTTKAHHSFFLVYSGKEHVTTHRNNFYLV